MGLMRPTGHGAYESFLVAQQESPTLTLAHAGLSDDGALEVAHFLSSSRHLIRLDLTGNNIASTGVFHLANAIKMNGTLESLILKHNRIGEFGEQGLASLCQALHGNTILKHLDLRHAGLQGAKAAEVIGEMLRCNAHMTHLELSWNALEPEGGQVLFQSIRVNTTLFDCQLTGCRIADETLLAIAELLHRNRKAKGADLQAGPYQACVDWATGPQTPALLRGLGGPHATSQLIECCVRDGLLSTMGGQEAATKQENVARAMCEDSAFSSMVVSVEATAEYMMRLCKFINSPSTSEKDAALAHQLYLYMDQAQKQLIQERNQVENIHLHLTAVSESFRDREIRSRDSLADGHRQLTEVKKETLTFRNMLERCSEELGINREMNAQMLRGRNDDEEQAAAEEALAKNKLAEIMAEKRELEKRLASLQEASLKQKHDNVELRRRVERLRQGVTLLHEPGRAGSFPESEHLA